jgi:hypothetical protein
MKWKRKKKGCVFERRRNNWRFEINQSLSSTQGFGEIITLFHDSCSFWLALSMITDGIWFLSNHFRRMRTKRRRKKKNIRSGKHKLRLRVQGKAH